VVGGGVEAVEVEVVGEVAGGGGGAGGVYVVAVEGVGVL
jgi:hypothetical protein